MWVEDGGGGVEGACLSAVGFRAGCAGEGEGEGGGGEGYEASAGGVLLRCEWAGGSEEDDARCRLPEEEIVHGDGCSGG